MNVTDLVEDEARRVNAQTVRSPLEESVWAEQLSWAVTKNMEYFCDKDIIDEFWNERLK